MILSGFAKVILGGLAAVGFFLFGDLDLAFQSLIFFLAADFFVGIYAAAVNREIESRKAWIGFGKKVLTLAVVAIAWQIDKLMNSTYVHLVATYGYIGSELFSIIENLGHAGVPLPAKLVSLFKRFTEQISSGDDSNKTNPPGG